MSTSDPSASKVNVTKFMYMKEHMAEMIRMMQHIVTGGNWESSGPILEGSAPYFENENQTTRFESRPNHTTIHPTRE